MQTAGYMSMGQGGMNYNYDGGATNENFTQSPGMYSPMQRTGGIPQTTIESKRSFFKSGALSAATMPATNVRPSSSFISAPREN